MSPPAPAEPRPEPLRTQRVPTAEAPPELWEELWAFNQRYVDLAREPWEQGMRKHRELLVYRGARSGTLAGFGAVDCREVEHEGRRAIVLITSNVLVDERYRSRNLIQRSGWSQFWRARLSHPRLPIYWFFVTFSYKSYLLLARNLEHYWPHSERPMPEWETGMRDALARELYGLGWDSTRGIRGSSVDGRRLHDWVAPINEAELDNPHIRFFAEQNPGYAAGDCLGCMAPLSAANWLSIGRSLARRALRRSRRSRPEAASPAEAA